jgi:tRNA pseudouridine38-40 synthase
MRRFKLLIEYDGRPFVGWQRQENGLSVQEVLENAAASVEEQPVTVFGAGRTDSGVHALEMAAHLDIAKDLSAETVKDALNYHMRPHPVSVLHTEEVDEEFHARFSCTRRHYLYRLKIQREPLALEAGRIWRRPYDLDIEKMQEAANLLLGEHDFTTFRSTQCQAKSPVKTLDALTVSRDGQHIDVICHARSFLHNQVRSLVGTLERVGSGRWPVEKVAQALAAKDRAACGPVAPADGLYFARADYDPDEL